MELPRYIDLHTHLFTPDPSVWAIRSFHQGEQAEAAAHAGPCSVGLHPWRLEAGSWEADWEWVEAESRRPEVVAIGEAGLDRLQGPELDFQSEVFLRHIRLAEERGKPLIVHCVRAWEEMREILVEARSKAPVVLHGFQKKPELLEQFLPLGVWFSFGAALLRQGSVTEQALRQAPADRFFLETDEGRYSIQAIYERAASIRGLEEDQLAARLHANLQLLGIHG